MIWVGFITNSLYQQNWGKRGTSENPLSPSQSQFQLSRNAASNSLLIWRTTGKTPAFGSSPAQTKLSPAG